MSNLPQQENTMATNKELEVQVKTLQERVARLTSSNSNLKDELVILKSNYATLVEQMNARLEAVHNKFRGKSST